MFFRVMVSVLTLGIGMAVGFTVSRPTLQSASAQERTQNLVRGYGRAISSLKPHESEKFTLFAADNSQSSFTVVPPGKRFVLTDVMYIAQGSVRQDLVVNIADATPRTQKSSGPRSEFTHSILFQVRLLPRESNEVHLCSGYSIPAGNSLLAFTNAGLEPEQYVSVAVTGYLIDE
jgi:hypothetical protein